MVCGCYEGIGEVFLSLNSLKFWFFGQKTSCTDFSAEI